MKNLTSESLRHLRPAILLWLFCLSPTRPASGAVVMADDFEPDIDSTQWSAFGGTVLATNYGGSVSGANSLWFGGEGSRFATTTPLDTTLEGWIDFHLRMAESDDSPWWDYPEMPEEGIVLEYSMDGGTNWATAAVYDTSRYGAWSRQVLPIPAGALSANTCFRWRQLQHSGSYYDHWALDDVTVLVGPTPPILSVQPTDFVAPVGGTARFSVSAAGTAPLFYQWQYNGADLPAETNSTLTLSAVTLNQAGTYRVVVSNAVASIASSKATLAVVALSGEPFRIATLTTNGMVAVSHEAVAGDEWGAMAVSGTHLFYSGRNTTARFGLADLAGGISVGQRYETLVSDLRSETVFALGNGSNLLGWGGGTVTTLLEIDGLTGQLTGRSVALSQPVAVGYRSGLFAGYGRIVLYSGNRVYDVALPSGTVADCGAMALPFAESTRNGCYYGLAEFWDRMISLVYVSNAQGVVRLRVPDGDTIVLAQLPSANEDAIAVSPAWYRWYLHDGRSLVVAEATFEPALPVGPRVFSAPQSQTVFAETNVTFSVTAIGPGPLSYQWRFQEAAIPDATNASLALTRVRLDQTGDYCVVVSNAYGSVTSSIATLTVVLPPVGSLDFTFDPDTRRDDLVNAIAVQPDGKILLGGRFYYSYGGFRGAIVRLHPDGREDSDFLRLASQLPNNTIYAVALQNDAQALLAGEFTAAGEWPNRIGRLQADGSGVDSTFNPGTGANNTVYAVALAPDGKVLIGGAFTAVNGVARNRIARLNANGSLDTTFNPGVGPESGSEVHALAVQSDGRVLIGGTFTSISGAARLRLARLNANGSVDSTYNPGGGLAMFDWVTSLVLAPDGKALAGGRFPPVGLSESGSYSYRGGLARLNPDGSLDTAFNPGVQVEWPNGIPPNAVVSSIAPQPDGKILIGGRFSLVNGVGRTHFARLNSDGSVDPAFVTGLINGDGVSAVATQGDGRVLASGRIAPVGLLRFNGDNGPPALGTQPADPEASLGFPVTFSVTLTNGRPPLSYQWYFNGTQPIADATNSTLTLPQVQSNDAGTYRVVVSNVLGEVSSQTAVLSVVSGPRLVSAGSLDGYAIGLRFNVPVTAVSAQNPLNYAVSCGGSITNAVLRPDGRTVLLRLQYPASTPFTVTASGIVDAGPGHSGGGTAIGQVEGLVSADLGSPAYPGSTLVCRSNTFEVVAGGADLWDTSDQGHFVYAEQAGDFDVKVRVRSLGPSDLSAKAGLMARESLNANSATLHVDAMPPPPMRNTAEATMRPIAGGTTVGWGMPGTPYNAGLIPAGWPNTWLRLARTGNAFNAYHSQDNIHWTLFGQTNRLFASTLYLGMASTAHNNATRTTALLSDYGPYEGELAEALDISGLVWTSMGDSPWWAQTAVTHDGSQAAQSGTIGHATTSILQTTVAGPGTLTFWWKVSSEPDHDRLEFELAGAEQCSIAGEVDWEQRTVAIPYGLQTLAWTYVKNDSGVQGRDAAWLDQVVFSPDPAPPVIITQPADQVVKLGSNAVFRVVAKSLSPLTFQWVFNETNWVGLPQSELVVPNVSSTQLGSYFVVVSNACGMVTSRVATLELAWPPLIVLQPQNTTVIAGDNAMFTVAVTNNATLPIGYQLRKGVTPITNVVLFARTCTLTLYHVTTNAACPTNGPGNYRVVVTNAASYLPGVGSGLVTLTVLTPAPRARIHHCAFGGDGCFRLQFSGWSGTRYTVLASTNLVDWQEVGVATEIRAGEFEFTDTAALERRMCFYRLRSP